MPGYSKSYQFSWAPDGGRLTFVDAGSPPALTILDTERFKKRTIELTGLKNGHLTSHWSPDGKWIAVSSPGSIRFCDPETREVREVVKGSIGSRICWSPDSRRLAAILDGKLTIIECNGQLVRHHGRADSVDDWSSDGELIVYEKHRVKKEVWILAIASGKACRVDWKAACYAGRWSPNGKHLAFWSNGMLMMTGKDGTHPVVIGETTGGTMPPSWLELVPAKGAK